MRNLPCVIMLRHGRLRGTLCLAPILLRRDEELDDDDEEVLCSVSMVDISALENTCALTGTGRAQPCIQTAAETTPSSPSSCYETFSFNASLTGV